MCLLQKATLFAARSGIYLKMQVCLLSIKIKGPANTTNQSFKDKHQTKDHSL